MTELAGAERSGELEIGLEPAIHLDGGVAGADRALAIAPGAMAGTRGPARASRTLDHTVVETHEAESAAIRIEIGSQVMQPGKRSKVLRGHAPVFIASS